MEERTKELFTINIPEELLCELTISIDVSQTLANRTTEVKALDLTLSKIAEDMEVASLTGANIVAFKRLAAALTTLTTRANALVVAIEQLLNETQPDPS